KTSGGQPIPSYEAEYAEIEAIARGIDDAGGGLLQFVPDLMAGDYEGALSAVFDVAAEVGLPVTFTLAIGNAGPPIHLDALRMVEKANHNGGDVTGQIFPRPIGLLLGLDLSGNPFVMYPSYREIAGLPLAERVAEMRKPEVRERILNDKPESDGHPLMFAAQAWNYMFP
ncbi:amidohydrolase, partial [Mycobacterium sp. ITM-2017-0098]